MNKQPSPKVRKGRDIFLDRIDAEATRKVKARRNSDKTVWFGLGMMGLVGWSVSIPTLLGAGLGSWIDRTHPGGHSWTLALLVAGLTVGCFNAWRWISKQDQAMHEDVGSDDE